MTVRCDIRRRADVRAAVAVILERWSAIDILINNAGVIQVGPLEHMTAEDFENAMATHFWGPLHLMSRLCRRCGAEASGESSISRRLAAALPCPISRHTAPASSRWSGCRTRFARSSIGTASASRLCRPA